MALPMTTQRAALAAAHPFQVVEPDAAALERRSPTHPFSCSTNLANEVTDHLRLAKLTASAWEVCAYMQRHTFGNAGWHRKRGQPETQCTFDLAAWATAIPCDRSNLRRTLAALAACQIIWLDLDPERPGAGAIGWQLDFALWQPYDQRRQTLKHQQERGGMSAMSQQQANMVKSVHAGSDHTCLPEAAAHLTMLACSEQAEQAAGSGSIDTCVQQAGVVNKAQEADASGEPITASDHARLAKQQGYVTMLAWSETAGEARSPGPQRKRLRKKRTETPDRVSEEASPSPTALLAAGDQDEVPADAPSSSAPSMSAHTKNEEPPLEAVAASQPAKQEAGWPSRQAWEQTDLDYYQRVLREREKERVALLTRLAHERIGVPLEKASYARIGALAKQAGAALLVKHILLAAANHIDGDPLAYLTKLVHSPQAGHARKKEASHESTRTPSSDNGDTPRRSRWDGWDVATAR